MIGVISLVRRRPGFPYDAEDQAFLQDVADRAALAVDNAKVYANLERRVRDRTTEVAAANRQLEAINRELETFAYSVSHDLRAPLRALDGFSLALLEDFADRLPGDAQDYLRRIRAASQRMGDLIDALLDLARVGRLPLVTAEIDLSALASAVGAELAAASPDRRVDLRVEGDLRTQGDARLLRVVMQNLLGNAWKFTGGTPDPEIQVGSATLADAPAFFVRDNGAGFDMRHADKLFGAFQRLHGAAEFPGTGIGLATVQRIIHRHGGQIRGDGRPGEGATFTFTLPAGPADAPPGPS
ncbi:MAG: hypothetical protein FJZ01_25360 [Candidatus Sericytochromatia bacterium]|nr:hypothetical protein [Candidatus Tanganyikabacteria bacterium]